MLQRLSKCATVLPIGNLMETAMHPAPDTPTAHPTGAGVLTTDTSFRCLHYRAHDLLCELVRAAEGQPGTFQRNYHTGLARKRLAEIADALGFDLAMRIPVEADASERDDDDVVWLTPAQIVAGDVK
jgi:hypothetical protein